MGLVTVPYLIGVFAAPPGTTFSGLLFGLEDTYSYIAKMRYGARDGWAYQIVYTTEPHRGGIVYTFYLGLGKLAALISGQGATTPAPTFVLAYHTARIVLGLLYLVTLYGFVAEILEPPPQRRLAWILAALAGGLGWGLLVARLDQGADVHLPVEFYVPEGFSLLLLYGLPHLSLARTLLLTGWMALFRAVERGRWYWAAAGGLAWFGMAMIVPFHVGLLGTLLAAWLAGLWATHRRFPWGRLGWAALAGVPPLLVLAYNAWLFSHDPVYAAWAAQNSLPSPPIIDYALAYGLLIGLATPGAIQVWRKGLTDRTTLLIVWPLVTAAMVYLPVNVQRRLLEGVIVPLCILATFGIWRLVGEKPQARPSTLPLPAETRSQLTWRLRQVGAGVLLMLLFPSTVLLLAGGIITALDPEWPVVHPTEELAALDWLRLHAPPGSIVLATHESGNLIPAYAGVRVYVGHGPESANGGVKRTQAEAFFHSGMTGDERRALLDEAAADYVWIGAAECEGRRASNLCPDLHTLPLREVFRSGRYAIYEVVR